MSTDIGFGNVGAGMVARFHARAIAATAGARLAAICRADASRADEAAAELGVPCEASLEALETVAPPTRVATDRVMSRLDGSIAHCPWQRPLALHY